MASGLQGTLSGMNALTPAEREILGQMQQLSLEREKANAAQAQAAEAQRQQASQELQQQVAAPPQAPGFETLIPMALGNLASLIGQSPEPMQRGRETVKENRGQILQARQENLKHLQNVYSQRAEEAQKAGDLEATEKYRRQYETLSKTLDTLGSALDRQGREKAAAHTAGKERDDRINQLTDNIRQDPDIKDYQVIRDQLSTGIDAVNANNSAGDIILMRAVARATDPRTGVREEEYKTFKGAQGQLATLGVGLTKGMIGQGQLTPFGRAQLLARLRSLESRKRVQKDRRTALYTRQANTLGVDPKDVLTDYGLGEEPATVKAKAIAAATSQDRQAFVDFIKQNPDLNNDPEIIAAARKLKAGKK